ncbi:rhomboid family intramembrane serine protease [Pseudoclavibacter chungangensis]|uniref:Rhomboid family intramembrane serine protease n=1 Tax=Pseudoclavibacter chungangensis TaxID=587635 RepID=A0A7J5BSQ6_9MICO|nr:DUF2156 domain-containing protein [Pseudoclavibacter chungangensis]KAB1657262.1 rhomboid family intramembrane serine protease [Pseudoclavibacter chungangensis]NYJ66294.1 lysylphosphatidylglycerol synthetase-like protein (DUF2156 family) [Pseudoclavibacter chungangensis]
MIRDTLARLMRVVRARPVTVTFAVTVLVVSIVALVARAVGGPDQGDAGPIGSVLATGLGPVVDDGRWWTVLSYPLLTTGPRHLVLALAVVVVLGGLVEPRLGTRRSIIALVTTTLAGALVGLALQGLSAALTLGWFPDADRVLVLDPIAPAVGLALAGSAALDRIHRRRTRVLVLVALVIGTVYLGQVDDFVRIGAGLAGLALGFVLVPRENDRSWRRSTEHETRVLLASTSAMLGIGPLLALIEPHRHSLAGPIVQLVVGRFAEPRATNACRVWDVTASCVQQQTVAASLSPVEVLVSALPWLVFVVIAWGIWRGRRLAIHLGIAANLLLVGLFVFYWILTPTAAVGDGARASRLDATQFVVQVVAILVIHVLAAVALWRWRASCPLPPVRARAIRALVAVVAAALVLMALYVAIVLADPSAWTPAPTLGTALLEAPERLLPPALLAANPVAFDPVSPLALALTFGIAPVFDIVVLLACRSALATTRPHERDLAPDRVRELLRRGGGGPIAHMATWPGMRTWLDTETGAAVTYRVEQRVAIVLGTPFGAPDVDDHDVLSRFATESDTNGLIPCFYSVPMTLAERFVETGWSAVEVAEESVIPLEDWAMKGKKWQDVRSSINRADREGVDVRWGRFDELTASELEQVREISAEWAGDKALPEMGFTLGGLAQLDDDEVLIALAVDGAGVVQAVTSWLPVWRDERIVGRTLDVMRRRPDSMNGVMEMLIARVAQRLQSEGAEFLSLSAAPLASSVQHAASDSGDASILQGLLHELGARLEPVYGFRSLLNFKRKFQPVMVPLGLVYLEPTQLPAIGLALTKAYLPGVTVGALVDAFRQARNDRPES